MKWWDTLKMREADDETFKRGTLALVDDEGKELIGLGYDYDDGPLMWVNDEVRVLLDRLHAKRVGDEVLYVDPVSLEVKFKGNGPVADANNAEFKRAINAGMMSKEELRLQEGVRGLDHE